MTSLAEYPDCYCPRCGWKLYEPDARLREKIIAVKEHRKVCNRITVNVSRVSNTGFGHIEEK